MAISNLWASITAPTIAAGPCVIRKPNQACSRCSVHSIPNTPFQESFPICKSLNVLWDVLSKFVHHLVPPASCPLKLFIAVLCQHWAHLLQISDQSYRKMRRKFSWAQRNENSSVAALPFVASILLIQALFKQLKVHLNQDHIYKGDLAERSSSRFLYSRAVTWTWLQRVKQTVYEVE